MSKKSITVACPATVANVVCGFDVMGFCLSHPADILTLSIKEGTGVKILPDPIHHLPTDPEKNVAGKALLSMLSALGETRGFELSIDKRIKPGSGIGSSAASAAGVVVAANELLGRPFTREQLVDFAMDGEEVASGSRHADNVAPAVLGGFTLVRSVSPFEVISLPYPQMFVAVLHPQIEVKTSDARAILSPNTTLKQAIKQWSNVGGLVAGLFMGDYEIIRKSLQDEIIETQRKKLIPYFDELKQIGINGGALGGGISGSGPSIFMLCQTLDTAMEICNHWADFMTKTEIGFQIHCNEINKEGVKVIE